MLFWTNRQRTKWLGLSWMQHARRRWWPRGGFHFVCSPRTDRSGCANWKIHKIIPFKIYKPWRGAAARADLVTCSCAKFCCRKFVFIKYAEEMFKSLQGITWRGGDKKQAGQEDWWKFKLFYSWKKSLRARRDWRALKSLLEMLMESSCSDWKLLMHAAAVAVSLPPTQDEEVDILFQIKQQNEMTSLLWSSFSSWACVSYSYSCRTKSRARRRLRIFFTCSHARFSPGKWWWIINHRRWERVLLLLTSAEPTELVIKNKKRKNNSLGPLPLFFKFSRTPSIHIPHPAV